MPILPKLNFHFLNCILFLFLCLSASAQYTTKSGRAIKFYEEAENYFKVRRFDEGMEMLMKALQIDPDFAEASYKMAVTAQLFQDHSRANDYFLQTIKTAPDNEKFKGAYYHLAVYAIKKGNYPSAKKYAEKFLSAKPSVTQFIKTAKKIVIDCNYALEGVKKPLNFKSKALGDSLNQFYAQYFPVLTGDGSILIFTARDQPPNNSLDSDENIFYSKLVNSRWGKPRSLSSNINSYENEGTASISADGKTLVFTSCDIRGRINLGQCDLYISTKTGDEWSTPVNLGSNINSAAWESQPSLSADGRALYFISNRSGGKGNRDIWVSYKNDQGEWSPAINVSEVNTDGEEVSPFIHPNNRSLFFGSNGYPGYGGYDLYKSELNVEKWSEPENLGYPINTYEDQLALFITADWKKGYYSIEELQDNKYLSSKINEMEVPESLKPKNRSNYVKGIVYDSKTKAPVDAKIELFDISNNKKQASTASDPQNGNYLLVLNQGAQYALGVTKKGYAFKSLTFNYQEEKDMEPLVFDIFLDPIAKGTTFRLNNIFFDYNKYELKETSRVELDELVSYMQSNAEIKGEISGHTDNIGDPKGNLTLSMNRAKAVYDFLIKAGIDPKRLTFKGYGATQPDAPNDTEEGRAKNRRIEFKIL